MHKRPPAAFSLNMGRCHTAGPSVSSRRVQPLQETDEAGGEAADLTRCPDNSLALAAAGLATAVVGTLYLLHQAGLPGRSSSFDVEGLMSDAASTSYPHCIRLPRCRLGQRPDGGPGTQQQA